MHNPADSPLAANRAQPGEQFQRDLGHPGSVLFSGSGSAIKRITAGVKAGPDRRCQVFDLVAGLHPPGKVSSERKKNIAFCLLSARPRLQPDYAPNLILC